MKNSVFHRWFSAFVSGAAVSLGAVGCVISAFDVPADMLRLVLLCLFFSAALPLLFLSKHSTALCFAALIACALWIYAEWEGVRNGLLLAEEKILRHYGRAYDFLAEYKNINFDLPEDTASTAFFAAIGGVLAFVAAWTVMGGYGLLPLAFVSGIFAVGSLMLVNIPPAPWAVMLLFGIFALLLLTQSLRKRAQDDGGRLFVRLALPAAALALILCLAVKPGEYLRPAWPDTIREKAEELGEKAIELFSSAGEIASKPALPLVGDYGILGYFDWNSSLEKTDLSTLGPQRKSDITVIQVMGSKSGRVYLRGNSFAYYDGESWQALEDGAYGELEFDEESWTGGEADRTIEIKTIRRSDILYIPYTPTELAEGYGIHFDAYVLNTGLKIRYGFPVGSGAHGSTDGDYESFVMEHYLQMPARTYRELEPIIEELREGWIMTSGLHPSAVNAKRVAEYVKSSAVYDLETSAMPWGADFVGWFLNESETGYCVHFASAAAMLLRGLGIPARYVTGYVAEASAGNWVPVKSDAAHAWVEYYVPGEGWYMLEATPADLSAEREEAAAESAPPTEEPQGGSTPAPAPTPTPGLPPAGNQGGAGESPSADAGEKERIRLPGWLWAVSALAAAPFLWRIGLGRVRKRRLYRGGINERALACRRHLLRLCRVSGEKMPDFVNEMAEKARFSRRGLSRGELERLTDWTETLHVRLREDRRPLRFILYRIIFAI